MRGTAVLTRSQLPERIRHRVQVQWRGYRTPCWVWTGSSTKGYGTLTVDKKKVYAHRYAYEETVGPIPTGTEADHLCRVTLCIRPDHLDMTSHAENIQRGKWGRYERTLATACLRGHPYPENAYVRSDGGRSCRRCHTEQEREGRERRRRV